jgi:signal peptidase II
MITALVLVLDQVTKYWASAVLKSGGQLIVVSGLMNFNYTENSGIAFGLLNEGNVKWLLIGVSIVAISVVLFYLVHADSSGRMLLTALALLAGGISGNLVDRIRMGSVIDFIEVYYRDYRWPVFNVADTAITVGAAILALDLFVSSRQAKAPVSEPEATGK